LCAATREAFACDERARRIGAVHLEAVGALHTGREADVVEDRADSHDLVVEVDALRAANRLSEQPRPHGVIEQIP
jgi:hypothetical protein